MTQSYQPAPFSAVPEAFGLYDPRFEHDGCGVSFICQIKGVASRSIVTDALDALCNLDHRGASGAEINTGDGAGILLQVPDRFLREVVDFALPPAGAYGVGLAFLPLDTEAADKTAARIDAIVEEEGLRVVGWREVPDRLVDDRAHRAERHPELPSAVRRRPLPGAAPPASSSTASCSWSASGASTSSRASRGLDGLLPVAVVPHARLQGDAHHPAAVGVLPRPRRRPRRVARWRWCTAASPPTRSRRGRSRTRTATSRTTARSTPCRATATGCGPVKRSWPPRSSPGWSARSRSSRPARPTPTASTSASSCCTSRADRSGTRR